MSLIKRLIEESSQSIPFDQAKPIVNYEERRKMSRHNSKYYEELEREMEREILGPPVIEGLERRPKKKIKKVNEVKLKDKKVKKSKVNLGDDIIKPKKSGPSLLSRLCDQAESKSSEG